MRVHNVVEDHAWQEKACFHPLAIWPPFAEKQLLLNSWESKGRWKNEIALWGKIKSIIQALIQSRTKHIAGHIV